MPLTYPAPVKYTNNDVENLWIQDLLLTYLASPLMHKNVYLEVRFMCRKYDLELNYVANTSRSSKRHALLLFLLVFSLVIYLPNHLVNDYKQINLISSFILNPSEYKFLISRKRRINLSIKSMVMHTVPAFNGPRVDTVLNWLRT